MEIIPPSLGMTRKVLREIVASFLVRGEKVAVSHFDGAIVYKQKTATRSRDIP